MGGVDWIGMEWNNERNIGRSYHLEEQNAVGWVRDQSQGLAIPDVRLQNPSPIFPCLFPHLQSFHSFELAYVHLGLQERHFRFLLSMK